MIKQWIRWAEFLACMADETSLKYLLGKYEAN
jgi:hypothetical protein